MYQISRIDGDKIQKDIDREREVKIQKLYAELFTYLNILDPFKISKVRLIEFQEDEKDNKLPFEIKMKFEAETHKFQLVDLEKVIHSEDEAIELFRSFKSFIIRIQDENSETYQTIKNNAKENILYLLRELLKKNFIGWKVKFILLNKKDEKGNYLLECRVIGPQLPPELRDSIGPRNVILTKPATLREKDFKPIILKALKKMNNLKR